MADPIVLGDATLYLGNCFKIVPTLGTVDAVFTDPPCEHGDQRYSQHFRQLVGLLAKHVRGPIAVNQKEPMRPEFSLRFPQGWAEIVCVDSFGPKVAFGPYDAVSYPCIVVNPPQHLAARLEQTVNEWPEANALGIQCAIPLQMATKVIEAISQPGDTILDPYMVWSGGSIGLAALRAGRKFIGISHDELRFKTVVDRLR